MIYRTYYLSPLGRILLAADDIGLIGCLLYTSDAADDLQPV